MATLSTATVAPGLVRLALQCFECRERDAIPFHFRDSVQKVVLVRRQRLVNTVHKKSVYRVRGMLW